MILARGVVAKHFQWWNEELAGVAPLGAIGGIGEVEPGWKQ